MNWPNTPSFLEKQRQRLERYQFQIKVSEQGRVVSVGDGIIWIKGLPRAAIDEILISEDECCIAWCSISPKIWLAL